MSTSQQDRDFLEALSLNNLLENSIEWIIKNFGPEEVFSTDALETWAKK